MTPEHADQRTLPAPDHSTPAVDPSTAVRHLLMMSMLAPSEEEIRGLEAGFAQARAGARSLYAVAEARYEQPAQVFRAVS